MAKISFLFCYRLQFVSLFLRATLVYLNNMQIELIVVISLRSVIA